METRHPTQYKLLTSNNNNDENKTNKIFIYIQIKREPHKFLYIRVYKNKRRNRQNLDNEKTFFLLLAGCSLFIM